MVSKRKGLGRGLDALLSSTQDIAPVSTDAPSAKPATADKAEGSGMRLVPVEKIERSPFQPRLKFDQAALEELASSIRSQGVIQPLVVRQLESGQFELIAGERRWRAAQLAGLEQVPVVIREVTDQVAMAMALIENIQRQDLNPLEEARGLQRLIDEFGLTHQKVAEAVGRSRVSVSNLLRLLDLHDEVKTLLERGLLDMGHARALLSLEGEKQLDAARTVIDKVLSVRQTEALVRQMLQPAATTPATTPADPNVRRLENELSDKLGAVVAIQGGGDGKGKVVIKYNSLDELDGILTHIR